MSVSFKLSFKLLESLTNYSERTFSHYSLLIITVWGWGVPGPNEPCRRGSVVDFDDESALAKSIGQISEKGGGSGSTSTADPVPVEVRGEEERDAAPGEALALHGLAEPVRQRGRDLFISCFFGNTRAKQI